MDVKVEKKFVNKLFDKRFYNDNSRYKRAVVSDDEGFNLEDRDVLDSYRDNKRRFEEY